MDFPQDLKYTKEHEWIRQKDSTAEIGVTGYAIEQLGDIVHLDLPEVGESFDAGSAFGTIESTKTVSDLYIPMACKVVAINSDKTDNPESIQDDPYGSWLVKVETSGAADSLLTPGEYEKFITEQDS